jgi:endoglucanase
MFAQITALALLAAKATATIYYAGVAESSGEFGVWSPNSTPGTGLPGRFGVEYAFINESAIDVYVDVHKVSCFILGYRYWRQRAFLNVIGEEHQQRMLRQYGNQNS